MHPDRAILITYSPTGTTRAVVAAIAEGYGATGVVALDLTLPAAEHGDRALPAGALVIAGVPVYAGRVPETAVHRLRRLRGAGNPTVLVAVYGNRAFEDALLELSDLVRDRGCVPVAAAAFIGEHSYSTPETPIAVGRPDAQDLARAAAFGHDLSARLSAVPDLASLPPLQVPGNRPHRRGMSPSDAAPVTVTALCTLCGECARVCPVGAIAVTHEVVTDGVACTLCCACVKVCPTGARVMEDEGVRRTARWLATEHGVRKEPEVFLP